MTIVTEALFNKFLAEDGRIEDLNISSKMLLSMILAGGKIQEGQIFLGNTDPNHPQHWKTTIEFNGKLYICYHKKELGLIVTPNMVLRNGKVYYSNDSQPDDTQDNASSAQ